MRFYFEGTIEAESEGEVHTALTSVGATVIDVQQEFSSEDEDTPEDDDEEIDSN